MTITVYPPGQLRLFDTTGLLPIETALISGEVTDQLSRSSYTYMITVNYAN